MLFSRAVDLLSDYLDTCLYVMKAVFNYYFLLQNGDKSYNNDERVVCKPSLP